MVQYILLSFCNSCSLISLNISWNTPVPTITGVFWFTHSHWLGIYNLANHNKVSPSKLVAMQTQLGFSNPIRTVHKIAGKSFKILTLKKRNLDGNRPSHLCQSISYISVVVACLQQKMPSDALLCFLGTFIEVGRPSISVNCQLLAVFLIR